MVFPISDDNSDRRTAPFVNKVLIGLNVLVIVVFWWESGVTQDDCTHSGGEKALPVRFIHPPALRGLGPAFGWSVSAAQGPV
jgi:hypothetical protein